MGDTTSAPDDTTEPASPQRAMPRRTFLLGGAAAAAGAGLAGWRTFRVSDTGRGSMPATPTRGGTPFPGDRYRQGFENWSGEIVVEDIWTCAPNTPGEVVDIVNWAQANGYTVRPRGAMHNFSPFTVPPGEAPPDVLLVDTTNLAAVQVDTSATPTTVTAQAGAMFDDILLELEQAGLGLYPVPAPGNITLGGALAVSAHGASFPAVGEQLPSGHTFGSISNAVIALTAVVWDPDDNQYALKTFDRSDPEIAALLTHLGRAFITEATLQVGPDYRLRCQSITDVPIGELYGPPGSAGRTFTSYLDASGRVEVIWFPFTDHSWLKVWTPTERRPAESQEVTRPYNYTFADQLDPAVVRSVAEGLLADPASAEEFGATQVAGVTAGLDATDTRDLWGWSRTVLHYTRPTSLRVTAAGAAVLTSRADIQRVVHEFWAWYQDALERHRAAGQHPVNMPLEIRCTGLDQPGDVVGDWDEVHVPHLSAARPRQDRPEWDSVVWISALTVPGTPGAGAFFQEMEQWLHEQFSGSYAAVRPEWSKGWAYTADGAWTDPDMVRSTVPGFYREPGADTWTEASAVLNRFDPHRLFVSPLLNELFP